MKNPTSKHSPSPATKPSAPSEPYFIEEGDVRVGDLLASIGKSIGGVDLDIRRNLYEVRPVKPCKDAMDRLSREVEAATAKAKAL